ncbi:MAG: archaeal heat shock protein Hsp20 [Acidilobaceae archaeon]
MFRPRRRRSIFDIFDEIMREFEERISEFEEEMEKAFKEKISREEFRGPYVYGLRITIGPDGIPRVEEFGNISRERRGKPLIREEMEPLVDVIERDDEVWVIADVPGVSREDIDVRVTEREVTIKAYSSERKYYKTIDLPVEVNPETAKASYRNGVLEIKIKKKKGGGEGGKGFKVTVE